MKESPRKKSVKAAAPALRAQDRFLTQMMEERRKVAVFLLGGVKLEAEIAGYDQHVIMMKGATTDQVYKHAVSTIQPVTEERPRRVGMRREGGARPPVISRRKPRLFGGDKG